MFPKHFGNGVLGSFSFPSSSSVAVIATPLSKNWGKRRTVPGMLVTICFSKYFDNPWGLYNALKIGREGVIPCQS